MALSFISSSFINVGQREVGKGVPTAALGGKNPIKSVGNLGPPARNRNRPFHPSVALGSHT
jgi:hypothetical protein